MIYFQIFWWKWHTRWWFQRFLEFSPQTLAKWSYFTWAYFFLNGSHSTTSFKDCRECTWIFTIPTDMLLDFPPRSLIWKSLEKGVPKKNTSRISSFFVGLKSWILLLKNLKIFKMVDILDVLNIHFVRLRIFFRFLMANDFPSHPMLSPDFSSLQTLGPFPVILGVSLRRKWFHIELFRFL